MILLIRLNYFSQTISLIKESANMREKNSGLEQFTNLYSLSKTLRFELIPVEGTAETIQQNDILAEDKKLADSYQKIKPTLDAFHRAFIDRCLSDVKLENLDRYYDLYHVGDEEKRTKKYQDELKKQEEIGTKTKALLTLQHIFPAIMRIEKICIKIRNSQRQLLIA